MSLIYENLSLNLLQQFEIYTRYYWINLKKKEIEEIAHKIIDGNYSLKKKTTNGNNVLPYNEKIVREFSKQNLSDALELFAAIGELYISVLEEFSKELKEKIDSLDSKLAKTELKEVTAERKKEISKKEAKTINGSAVSLDENLKLLLKIFFPLAGIAGVTYILYCLFHSTSTSLK